LAVESEAFSGAEIEQAVIAALYECLARRCGLSTEMLVVELRRTVPLAVSRREEIEQLRAFAAGRFVAASVAEGRQT
jgi:hypothetical protein